MTPTFISTGAGMVRGHLDIPPGVFQGALHFWGFCPDPLYPLETIRITMVGPDGAEMTALCEVRPEVKRGSHQFAAMLVAWELNEPLPGVIREDVAH